MKLAYICDRCNVALIIHSGDVESTPYGFRLSELIASAHDNHTCRKVTP